MGLSDGNLSHVLVTYYVEDRETFRTGLPFVGGYTCVCLRTHIHRCTCMRVCGGRLSKDIWISRVSRVEERSQDRDSEMDVCI